MAAAVSGTIKRIVGDKGFAGREFEQDMTELGITFVRPDRRNETRRHGNLAIIRQHIESIINTAKRQLSVEQHGARTPAGVIARVAQRLLALAAAVREAGGDITLEIYEDMVHVWPIFSSFLPEGKVEQLMEEIRGPAGRTMWDKLGNVNEAVLAAYPDAACIGVDIPIGLAEGEPRRCDVEARRVLGQKFNRDPSIDAHCTHALGVARPWPERQARERAGGERQDGRDYPRDGHGNHEAAGLITREAFRAAADPARFASVHATHHRSPVPPGRAAPRLAVRGARTRRGRPYPLSRFRAGDPQRR